MKQPLSPPRDARTPQPPDAPRLPHERDESVGMTNPRPNPRIKQGHDDMARGVQDTSRAPEADRAYRGLKQGPGKSPDKG